jgi:hypothetical protein
LPKGAPRPQFVSTPDMPANQGGDHGRQAMPLYRQAEGVEMKPARLASPGWS